MAPSVPRISEGASGLGSKESRCVTPPAIHSTITERAVPVRRAGRAWAGVTPSGSSDPATASEPTRSRSRRPRSPSHASGESRPIVGLLRMNRLALETVDGDAAVAGDVDHVAILVQRHVVDVTRHLLLL